MQSNLLQIQRHLENTDHHLAANQYTPQAHDEDDDVIEDCQGNAELDYQTKVLLDYYNNNADK